MKLCKNILLTIGTILFLSSLLTGCNTIKGAGQDISQGGQAISNAASS